MRQFYRACLIFLAINIIGLVDLWAKDINFSQQAKEYRNIGYLALRDGNLEKAYQFLKKSVYLDPQDAIVHNDLGIIYEKRGLKELAGKEYSQALTLDPKYPPPYMNLALLYIESGNKDKAIFYLKERIKLGKKKDPWREKARDLLQRYEAISPAASPQAKRRIKEDEVEKSDIALHLMEEARLEKLASSPDKDSIMKEHFSYAKAHYQQGDYVKALEEFKLVEKLEQENTEVLNYIRDCQDKIHIEELYAQGKEALDNGDFSLAISKINELLLLDPMYKDAEEILISAEKEKFVQETRKEEPLPIIVHIP